MKKITCKKIELLRCLIGSDYYSNLYESLLKEFDSQEDFSKDGGYILGFSHMLMFGSLCIDLHPYTVVDRFTGEYCWKNRKVYFKGKKGNLETLILAEDSIMKNFN